jgi:putative ABC transport system permease protein
MPLKVSGALKSTGQTPVRTSTDDIIFAPSKTVLHRLSGGRFISLIQASAVLAAKSNAA